MIQFCDDERYFLEICDKLNSKKLQDIRLTQTILYKYMIAGLYSQNIFTYTSHDNNKMNGCMVLICVKDILGESVLSLLFAWIDAHYPKLHREFIEKTRQKARELGITRIVFQTNRNEKLINRKMGKYGFNKIFSVYEKKEVI